MNSDLETWADKEHPNAYQSHPQLYYGASVLQREVAARDGLVELCEIVEAGYAECAPRRQLIARIRRAIDMIEAQQAKEPEKPARLQRMARAQRAGA